MPKKKKRGTLILAKVAGRAWSESEEAAYRAVCALRGLPHTPTTAAECIWLSGEGPEPLETALRDAAPPPGKAARPAGPE